MAFIGLSLSGITASIQTSSYHLCHSDYDNKLLDWLKENPDAKPKQFTKELNRIYKTPDMKQRFGPGVKFK